MSKFYAILFALLCTGFSVSCDDDDDLTPVNPDQEQTDPDEDQKEPEKPVEAQIALENAQDARITMEDAGGSKQIKFTASKAWTAQVSKSAEEWLQVQPTQGEAGSAEISITAQVNSAVEGRMGQVTLKCEDKKVEITVNQVQKDALVVAQPAYEVAPEGGEIVIKLGHNVDFEVEIQGEWISRNETRAYIEEEIAFTAQANEGDAARSGKIIFRSSDKKLEQVVTIAQNGSVSNFVNIPDPKFKEYLIANYDADGDGELSFAEAETVYYIEVRTNGMHSAKGIECMPNIMYLILDGYDADNKVADGDLTELDVTKNPGLSYLECWYNKITKLDVSQNTDLSILGCWGNQITELNLENNTALATLFCQDNQLTKLDLSKNTALKELYCEGNKLQELNLKENAGLEKLWCGRCELTTLDLSGNKLMTNLRCEENHLTELNVSNNVQLIELRCADNEISTLNVRDNIFLTELKCFGNKLTELDLSQNDELNDLFCHNNQLETLDISANPAMIWLRCENNSLKSLKLGNNTNLIQLYCQQNQLSELNISTATAIEWLNATENPQLKQITVWKGFNPETMEECFVDEGVTFQEQ